MEYIKVIQTGHVVEVYEMERGPFLGDKSGADLDKFDYLQDMYFMFNAEKDEIQERNRQVAFDEFTRKMLQKLERGDRTMERSLH